METHFVPPQPHEREEDLRDDQRVQTPVSGEPPRLLPDRRPRLLRHGVFTGRRSHDPHPQRCLLRGPDQVRTDSSLLSSDVLK